MPNCVTNKELDDLIEKTTSPITSETYISVSEFALINDVLRELRRARKKLSQLNKVVKASEDAVDDWERGLKAREHGTLLAVRNIQRVQVVVNEKRQTSKIQVIK